jgi:isopenicillin N synthase-like dioxygenase
MDLKEFWHVGRDPQEGDPFAKYFLPNIWPNEIPEFKDLYIRLYQELDKAGFVLLKALTGPLELPEDYFDELAGGGSSILRLLHYPPIPNNVDPRCVRAAAHEDINLITLLVCASASGLQIMDRNGKWLDVETAPHLITVDAGDMLSRITNDVIPSTTHRVINPQDGKNEPRFSMPFFMHPHPEAILKCIPSCKGNGEKYPPIKANDFLMQRLRDIGLIKDERLQN